MSKPAASRAWVRVLCFVSLLTVVAVAMFILSPTRRGSAARGNSVSKPAIGTPASRRQMQASYAALPLAFEQNQGQTDDQVKFLARGNGYTLFLTENDAVFSFHSRSAEAKSLSGGRAAMLQSRNASRPADTTAVVRMQLAGANSLARISAGGQLPGKSNYFFGSDSSKWRTDVPHYARVSYADVYPGVNLAFHGAQRQIEFDFVVAPGANPAPIAFNFTGAQAVKTDDSGNLVVSSAAGDVLLHKPIAYQEQNGTRQIVDARFVLRADNQINFELGKYDRARELVIDPSVSYEYSTYLGGSGADEGNGIAFASASGNAYVTGETASANFPGASNTLTGTAGNVFVTQFAADGSALIYSTYIGGSGANGDSGNAIAVDASGDAFVTGGTSSSNFPTTSGVFQSAPKGSADSCFVLELNPTGTMTYSTYLGGSGGDAALGIAVDGSGNTYTVGKTASTDFPTASPLQAFLTGSLSSGFVTELNPTGTSLVYSTYLGGGQVDQTSAIALDSSGNAYVIGETSNPSFTTTSGSLQPHCGSCVSGHTNAFVTAIAAGGGSYVYSTFLGGSGSDVGLGIAVDSSANAYVTGSTNSSNFPQQSSFQAYGGSGDAFVAKLNPTGSALIYSSYLGGSGADVGTSIAVDGNGNAYVTGSTASSADFPLASATQTTYGGGGSDAFVSEVSSTPALTFSTYLGGSGTEDAGNFGGIAVDALGDNVYVTGSTDSTTGFPTASPFQTANGGMTDAFVVKYAQGPTFTLVASTPSAVSPGTSSTSTVTLKSFNGYSANVELTCSVSGTGTPAPTCSVTGTNPVVPVASPGATSMVTISTTAAAASTAVPGKIFYAMWLPVAGLSLVGIGFGSARSRRQRLLGMLMLGLVASGLLLMPACGGSSSTTCTSNCGGGGGGTPAGSYTVTITGKGGDANTITYAAQVTLKVN